MVCLASTGPGLRTLVWYPVFSWNNQWSNASEISRLKGGCRTPFQNSATQEGWPTGQSRCRRTPRTSPYLCRTFCSKWWVVDPLLDASSCTLVAKALLSVMPALCVLTCAFLLCGTAKQQQRFQDMSDAIISRSECQIFFSVKCACRELQACGYLVATSVGYWSLLAEALADSRVHFSQSMTWVDALTSWRSLSVSWWPRRELRRGHQQSLPENDVL